MTKEIEERPDMPCNDRCVMAKSVDCSCSCAGENHGSGIKPRLFTFTGDGMKGHPALTGVKIKPVAKYIVGNVATRRVYFDGRNINPAPSLKVRNHSPSGFCWGYSGSGPAQLALAILMRVTDKDTAEKYYQPFKFEVVSGLAMDDDFKLPISKVRKWLKEKEYEKKH